MYRDKRINYRKVIIVLLLLTLITGILYALDNFDGHEVQEVIQSIEDCVAIDGTYPNQCTLPGDNVD